MPARSHFEISVLQKMLVAINPGICHRPNNIRAERRKCDLRGVSLYGRDRLRNTWRDGEIRPDMEYGAISRRIRSHVRRSGGESVGNLCSFYASVLNVELDQALDDTRLQSRKNVLIVLLALVLVNLLPVVAHLLKRGLRSRFFC